MQWGMGHAARAAALVALYLLPAVIVAGCGPPSASSANDTTPEATAIGAPSPEGGPEQTISEQVRVTLTKDRFGPQESLMATIQNGLATPIWSTDHHSGCSLLALEYFTGGAWDVIGQCTQARPPKIIEISAGASLIQSIGLPQEMDMGAGWPSGTYRLTLSYAMSQDRVASATPTTVHSTQFTIG